MGQRARCIVTGPFKSKRGTGEAIIAKEFTLQHHRNTRKIANQPEFSPEKRRVLPQALDDDWGDGRIAPIIPFTNPQEEFP